MVTLYSLLIWIAAATSVTNGLQCASDEVLCADGTQCTAAYNFCDELQDCRDGSDEILRNVSVNYNENETFCHGQSGYICVVRSDIAKGLRIRCQEGPHCKSNQFLCADGSRCIYDPNFCNGFQDCRDGSDEPPLRNISINYNGNETFCRGKGSGRICVIRTDLAPSLERLCKTTGDARHCEPDEFSCEDGSECIYGILFCDGHRNCRDGSDEPPLRNISTTYDAKETFCRGKGSGNICVLRADLAPSLERYCRAGHLCGSDEFSCADGSRCIKIRYFCDGHSQCRDGSDERLRILTIESSENETFCRRKQSSNTNICILPKDIAPRLRNHCHEGHECQTDEFSCADGSQCISEDAFCDGKYDCNDKSDEPPLRNISIKYDANETFCRGKIGGFICVLRADLEPTLRKYCKGHQCKGDEFPCEDGSQCVSSNKFCDAYLNCRDGSDERRRNIYMKYDANQTFCRGKSFGYICVFRADLAPIIQKHCDVSGHQCRSDEFSCTDGSQCIPGESFCDGYPYCRDGSDHPPLRHVDVKYDANETFCRTKSGRICVLRADLIPPPRKVCKPVSGHQCEFDEFPCADWSQCIPANKFCDGTFDCRDGSDELTSNVKSFRSKSGGNSCQNIHSGSVCTMPSGVDPTKKLEFCKRHFLDKYRFGCLSNPSVTILKSNLCNGVFDCPDRSDECLCSNARREICQQKSDEMMTSSGQTGYSYYQCRRENKVAMKCDGVAECKFFWDEECNCTEIPKFCSGVEERYSLTRCDHPPFEYTLYDVRSVIYFVYINGGDICDGVGVCNNDNDERDCEASR